MGLLVAAEEGFLAVEEVVDGVLNRTSRMSPTLAASGFAREKRRVRAPVGSRRES